MRSLKILSFSFFFVFLGAGSLQPYLNPYLKETCNLSFLQTSLILTLVYLMMGITRFFVGYLVSIFGLYFSLIFGAITYSLFVIVMGYCTMFFPFLLFASLLWGMGAALFWTGSESHILNTTPVEKYGAAIGTLRLFTHLGLIAGFFLLGQALLNYGYSGLFYLATGATALGSLAVLFIAKENISYPKLHLKRIFELMRALKLISLSLFVAGFAYGIILNLLNFFVKDNFGMRMLNRTLIFYYFSAGIFSLLGGFISDRIGRSITFTFAFLAGTLGLAVLFLFKNIWGVFLCSFLLGMQFGTILTVAAAWLGDMVASEERPTALGLLFSWASLGVAFSIILSGLLSQGGIPFDKVLLTFAAIFFLLFLLSAFQSTSSKKSLVELIDKG
ncbi:MAG: MFS transporter, partial [Candidatus Omnitrophica bacterium]|nr:MFS transporter [Candidatus Omnitrophota bacterium]